MLQIIPIKDLKDTSAISEMCHQTDKLLLVTKNGYDDMVSMGGFESMQKNWAVYKEIEQAEKEIAQGRVLLAREGLAAVKSKYGCVIL